MCKACVRSLKNITKPSNNKVAKFNRLSKGLLGVLLALIGIYQRYISPNLPARCRYYPTCSAYARQALLWHGVYRGGLMAIGRILRCQPWGGAGIDFVPVPMANYLYFSAICRHSYLFLDKYSYRMRLTYLLTNH